MSDLRFCPECGAELTPNDRFCGDCGFDTHSLAVPVQTPAPAPVSQQLSPAPQVPYAATQPQMGGKQQTAAENFETLDTKSAGNKKALTIMISLLAVLFLGGGGVYWWLSGSEDPGPINSVPSVTQNNGAATSGEEKATPDTTAQVDLTRASTYLSEPGLKCTFFVNYPDGTVGVVERISGQAVPNEAVRVSEVETGVERGEAFGYVFHYVERADGTYYILDSTPNEIFPLLKNNLTVGQTWNYQNEFGLINWTVLDMGVDLDLGFATLEDCLLVQEDNQMAEFQIITYYAPGRGSVLVIDPGGTIEYYRMTALTQIDPAQAAETVIRWSPNYETIVDDRTQSY